LVRVNIFLAAYFKYRTIALEENERNFESDEAQILEELIAFYNCLPQLQKYSPVSRALFLKTFRQSLVQLTCPQDKLLNLSATFEKEFRSVLAFAEDSTLSNESQMYLA
jgi:anthranilate phosphoribosyltransferase